MSHAIVSGSSNASSYAYFSRPMYHLWWVGILVLHCIGAAYYIAAAFAYWYLSGTYLDSCLAFYSLGLPSKYHHMMGRVHAFMGTLHCGLLLWMLTWSIRRRAFVFGFAGTLRSERRNVRELAESLKKQKQTSLNALWHVSKQIYNATLGRRGLFGVENPWFDVLLVLREIVETALQTDQAYRMSRFLPRIWINRFYVGLLVLNCWSTALIHHLYHDSPSRRRVLSILCDCILDTATTIAIPALLVLSYAKDYDFSLKGFDSGKWTDDIWFVNVLNEFQMILVVSWADLATRMVFSFGMISSMNGMKNLVRPCVKRTQVQTTMMTTAAPGSRPSSTM
uniref:Uncharacterized protein n=1 Tax=Globisporangium ultimum (strain ATCC 200006 / CBS 805.95 / DAOM BR144) TaxID=431595 RepID=K3WCV0_GLOUD